MELYNKVSDITYQSELIPDALFCETKHQVLIRPNNLRSFHSVRYGLIKDA